MKTPQIAVIGAGPAGLAVAHFLAACGLRPVVYEASERIGGLAGAVALWGRTFDIGPHIVLTSCQPEAVAFWQEIGGDDLLRLPLSRGMVLRRRVIDFPPRMTGLLAALGPRDLFAGGMGALRARARSQGVARDAAAFFRARYGERFRDLVFQPFCEKYMGLPDHEVDVDFARGLTSFAAGPQPGGGAASRCLLYPRHGGSHMMWSRVAERIEGRQGRVVLGKALARVVADGTRIRSLRFADGSSVEPDFVVSTLPIGRLLQAIEGCPASLHAEAARLGSRSTVLVYLRIAGQRRGHHYLTVFDRSLAVGRITDFAAWQAAPPADEDSVLCLEYWCGRGDALWASDDAALVALATRELEQLRLVEPRRVRDAHVLRLPQSHPVLTIHHGAALAAVNGYLDRFENLAATGRHASFRWDGQTDNIVAGMRLAERIEERLTQQPPLARRA